MRLEVSPRGGRGGGGGHLATVPPGVGRGGNRRPWGMDMGGGRLMLLLHTPGGFSNLARQMGRFARGHSTFLQVIPAF